ncbi:MAG: helix-turn-helix domain-containing protein [Nanoarchaeota archaeon]|nr:helix-turn-helix domain-containing protein [Nanoarchaeota archaeon]
MSSENKSDEKKNLEATLKEKVLPLVEEQLAKHWGVTIPQLEADITDQLKREDTLFYITPHTMFREARKQFKAAFLRRELRSHHGNISHLARALEIDRRSLHRVIKDLELDVEELRQNEAGEDEQQVRIDQRLRIAFDQYKELIQPQKMERMYEEIPALSRNIAKMLPQQHLTWGEAEKEFEQQFFTQALKEHQGSIAPAARCMGLRAETVHRKIRKLRVARTENL